MSTTLLAPVSLAAPPLLLLHSVLAGAWGNIMALWSWEPSILLGCAGLLLGYVAVQRFRLTAHSIFFTLGVLVLLLALVSPLHVLGESYLFSAHMIQHLLLVLVVPPLLIVGIPASLYRRLLQHPIADRVERVLGQPPIAWALATVALYVWHAPVLFDLTLHNEPVHIAEHLIFLVTGAIFWWPIVTPLEERRRMNTMSAVVYLFSAGVTNCVLGIVLSFSQPGIYPTYVSGLDPYGVLAQIRNDLHLTPQLDQQLGGMIMWVPGCLVYLAAIVGTLARWYGAPEPLEAADGELRATNY